MAHVSVKRDVYNHLISF